MHLEFLVEEPSAEAALRKLVPKIIGTEHTFAVHPHQGRKDLLQRLGRRLRGYSHWLPATCRIVVLIDEDRADCHRLKRDLEAVARDAGLSTPAAASASGDVRVVNRIAVEELEAWFLGDAAAVRGASPRVSPRFETRKTYRDPDAVAGGTWEALERLLQRKGYHQGGLAKIEAATRISEHMDPDRNRSRSFVAFRDALRLLVGP